LQVTQDHTTAAIRGLAVSAQGKHAAARQGILERYLGRQALVEVDLFTVNMRAGDLLMLCSRGLWGMVGDAELAQILATPGQHPSQLSGTLVQRALNYGGVENISIIVVRCPAEQDEE
jgi:protein phosphatase